MREDAVPPLIDLHPSETAGGKISYREVPERLGIQSDANFVRCQQCGYPIDRSTTSPGNGYGNITAEEVTGETVSGTITCRKPVVNGGCPFCGSSNYDPQAGPPRARS